MSDAQAPIRHSAALEAAVGLFKAPDRAALLHAGDLPDDVLTVIRIASGDRALAEACEASTGLAPDALQEACVFYIQSVLFHPDSDHFRVLGAGRDADQDTLKQHYRWLQKWLHPDRDPEGWSSVYSHRVNIAWDTLKRPDRRAAYRESLPAVAPVTANASQPRAIGTLRVAQVDVGTTLALSSKWIRRLPAALAVVTVVVAAGLWAAHRAGQDMLQADGRRATPPAPAGVIADRSQPPLQVPSDVGADAPAAGAPVAAVVEPAPAAVVAADIAAKASESAVASPDVARTPAGPVAVAAAVLTPTEPAARAAEPSGDTVVAARAEVERAALPARPAATSRSPATAQVDAVGGETRRDVAMVRRAEPVQPSRASPASAGTTAGSPSQAPVLAASDVAEAPRATQSPEPVAAPASEPAQPVVNGAPIAAATAAALMPAADARPAPLQQGVVGAGAVPAEQVRDGVRLIREFSEAYRRGDVQRVVVLFKPNARTPAGNLLDLHGAYQTVFAQSARRSLEFLQVDWRVTEAGIEGTGRYEWAMQPRAGSTVRAAGGQFRIVIEFDGGRPLIARFEQQDVG